MSSILKNALLLILLVGSSYLKAQYEASWDTYGVAFEFAQDFSVTQNSGTVFEAVSSDRLLYINVQPWSNSSVTVNDLYGYAVQTARNFNYDLGSEVSGDYIQFDDFQGYFLIASTNDPRSYNYYIVAHLLDSESDTNFQILIGFQEGHYEEAIDMLLSFYAYD